MRHSFYYYYHVNYINKDTVAALTLVKEQYYPVLNSILFGEGIFNDAVSILLFRSVQ